MTWNIYSKYTYLEIEAHQALTWYRTLGLVQLPQLVHFQSLAAVLERQTLGSRASQ